MARTDLERYDETYTYLFNIDKALAREVDQIVSESHLSKPEHGRALSLKGIGMKGSFRQHKALRALLLCQFIYLQPPWARKETFKRAAERNDEGGYDTVGGTYDWYYLDWKTDVSTSATVKLSEAQIVDMIHCYATRINARAEDLALAAEGPVVEGQAPDYRSYTRNGPTPFGSSCICYDAVRAWLFKSGFVSMRWLTHEGPSLIARTANDMLGLGRVIREDQVDRIPRGYIFNFHGGVVRGVEARDVCHWGVSLGDGIGAATNTTDGEKGRTVHFSRGAGPGRYGVFRLRESYEVCKLKYGGSAIIRQIDPATVEGLY